MIEIRPAAPLAAHGIPQHPALWRGGDLARMAEPGVPSGFAALDAQLPGGGWPVGGLTEIMPVHEGIGELRLLGSALARLSGEGRHLTWIAPPHLPYAPALAAAGIRLAQLAIVRTKSPQDTLWAAEQALRANACGALLAWPAPGTDYASLRRLQIAAEGSRALAFLFRQPEAARHASPAVLRLALDTDRGGLAVSITKRRGAPLARPILIAALARGSTPASAIAAQRHPDNLHALDRHPPAAPAAGGLPPRHACA
jgi:cell division inhibitor SulA/protein ImuA